MKQLSIIVVFLAATGIGVAFRNGMSGTSEAARAPISQGRVEKAAGVTGVAVTDRPASKTQGPTEGAALSGVTSASGAARNANDDLAIARIAADCGNRLFEKARRASNDATVLQQAAQHYRACLAHETSTPGQDTFFREVRTRLEEIEKLLTQPRKPAAEQAAIVPEEKPAVVSTPEVQPTSEPKMVGPDGVPIVRVPSAS